MSSDFPVSNHGEFNLITVILYTSVIHVPSSSTYKHVLRSLFGTILVAASDLGHDIYHYPTLEISSSFDLTR